MLKLQLQSLWHKTILLRALRVGANITGLFLTLFAVLQALLATLQSPIGEIPLRLEVAGGILCIAATVTLLIGCRLPRYWGSITFGILGLPACGIVWITPTPEPIHWEELHRNGDQLILALEAYRESCGSFPLTLHGGGITPTLTPYGPWQYEVSKDRQWFVLRVGDYVNDGFTLSYYSWSGQWDVGS